MASLQGGGGGSGTYTPPPMPKPKPAPMPDFGYDFPPMPEQPIVDNRDYEAEARGIYAPQFDYLDKAGKDSVKRSQQSNSEIAGLYAALAKQIAGQESGIRGNFDGSIKAVANTYGNATKNVNDSYNTSRNGVADTLKRLGITEAAPNTTGKQSQQQALMNGILTANNSASQNALQQMKAAGVRFNTESATNSRYVGAEKQSGLRNQLSDFLNQISMKRADIETQVGSTAAGFRNDAAGQAQKAQDAAYGRQQDAYSRWKDERDFNYRMGKDVADRDLAAQKLNTGGKDPKLDPLGEVNALAQQLYPNSQAAGNAMRVVTDAVAQVGQTDTKMSYAAIMNRVRDNLLKANGRIGDEGELSRLVALVYKNLYS